MQIGPWILTILSCTFKDRNSIHFTNELAVNHAPVTQQTALAKTSTSNTPKTVSARQSWQLSIKRLTSTCQTDDAPSIVKLPQELQRESRRELTTENLGKVTSEAGEQQLSQSQINKSHVTFVWTKVTWLFPPKQRQLWVSFGQSVAFPAFKKAKIHDQRSPRLL